MEIGQFERQLTAVYVQQFEQLVSEHRERIKELHQLGASTFMAEKLLVILQDALERMEQHLNFVTDFVPIEDSSGVAHANEN